MSMTKEKQFTALTLELRRIEQKMKKTICAHGYDPEKSAFGKVHKDILEALKTFGDKDVAQGGEDYTK